MKQNWWNVAARVITLHASNCMSVMPVSYTHLHVEGPYLNPKRAGEQFAGKLKNPDKEEYTSLLESTDCIKRWDASPELPGALEFARYLKSKGVLVAVSHTESEYGGICLLYTSRCV